MTLLQDARVCYPDFHLGNLGGPQRPGVLLDPDALCDPWHDALVLGYYSPVSELAPAAFDNQPVAAAALRWYCRLLGVLHRRRQPGPARARRRLAVCVHADGRPTAACTRRSSTCSARGRQGAGPRAEAQPRGAGRPRARGL